MKKEYSNGFTLAEVLITLGIIGVVAAITIPGLMTKLNNIKLKSQFKEAYSLLAQAVRMYNEDCERIEYIANSNNYIYKSFMKYFTGVTDCGDTGGVADDSKFCIVRQSNVDDTPNTVTNKDYDYSNYAKNAEFITTNYLDDGQFFLNNGMLIMFDHNHANPFISIDINGKLHKPNAWGHDVFTFELIMSDKEGGYELVPMGAPRTVYANKYDSYCSETSTNTMNGLTCAYKAMTVGDYFKTLP